MEFTKMYLGIWVTHLICCKNINQKAKNKEILKLNFNGLVGKTHFPQYWGLQYWSLYY